MLMNVTCEKCGKKGKARYMNGKVGLSYSAWLCPKCREEWKKSKIDYDDFIDDFIDNRKITFVGKVIIWSVIIVGLITIILTTSS